MLFCAAIHILYIKVGTRKAFISKAKKKLGKWWQKMKNLVPTYC